MLSPVGSPLGPVSSSSPHTGDSSGSSTETSSNGSACGDDDVVEHSLEPDDISSSMMFHPPAPHQHRRTKQTRKNSKFSGSCSNDGESVVGTTTQTGRGKHKNTSPASSTTSTPNNNRTSPVSGLQLSTNEAESRRPPSGGLHLQDLLPVGMTQLPFENPDPSGTALAAAAAAARNCKFFGLFFHYFKNSSPPKNVPVVKQFFYFLNFLP